MFGRMECSVCPSTANDLTTTIEQIKINDISNTRNVFQLKKKKDILSHRPKRID